VAVPRAATADARATRTRGHRSPGTSARRLGAPLAGAERGERALCVAMRVELVSPAGRF